MKIAIPLDEDQTSVCCILARAAVQAFLAGELVSTGSVCHEHQHAGECGNH